MTKTTLHSSKAENEKISQWGRIHVRIEKYILFVVRFSIPPVRVGSKKCWLVRPCAPDLHDAVRRESDAPVIVRQVRVEVDDHVISLGSGERKKREQPRATEVCLTSVRYM